jgi:iron-sulfur cluster repair protein YtfE (RIC family)
MSTYAESREEAWNRRAGLTGDVDFTMMYIAHDAFNRDMNRLVTAADAGRGLSQAAVATWRVVSAQLHTHHTAEDKALWPALAAVLTDPGELRVTEQMAAEHATLDPRMEQIDAAIAHKDGAALAAELKLLAKGLSAHMVHEETEALPLAARRLGKAGWDAFTREVRAQQGIRGAAQYLPWVLEGASEPVQGTVMQMLPPPARLLYRRVWEPRYRKSALLDMAR